MKTCLIGTTFVVMFLTVPNLQPHTSLLPVVKGIRVQYIYLNEPYPIHMGVLWWPRLVYLEQFYFARRLPFTTSQFSNTKKDFIPSISGYQQVNIDSVMYTIAQETFLQYLSIVQNNLKEYYIVV